MSQDQPLASLESKSFISSKHVRKRPSSPPGWRVIHQLIGSSDKILAMCCFENYLFSSGSNGIIYVWDLISFQLKHTLVGHKRSVLCLVHSPEKNLLFSSASDNSIKIWSAKDIPSGMPCLCTIDGFMGDIFSLAFYDNYLYLGCQNTTIIEVDLSSFIERYNIEQEGDPADATLGGPPRLEVENMAVHIPERPNALQGHFGFVYSLKLSGHYLISASGDGTLKLWDLKKKGTVQTMLGHVGSVFTVTCDGTRIFSGGQDATIRVWDLETGYLQRTITGHKDEVLTLSLSPSFFLYSGSADGVIKIWNKDNLQCLQTLKNHAPIILAIVSNHSEDGLFFSNSKRNVLVWDIDLAPSEAPSETDSPASSSSVSSPCPSNPSLVELGEADKPLPVYSRTNLASESQIGESLQRITARDILAQSVDLASDLMHREPLIRLLAKFVSIPTVSGDPNFRNDCWRGAKFLRSLFERSGFQARLVEGSVGKNPLVFARLGHDKAKPTVTMYGHYDVFPVLQPNEWESDPFMLTGRNGYLYGRGVTDDKGPILAALVAARELHLAQKLPVNMVFIIEGEEECDSEGFTQALLSNSNWWDDTNLILLSNTVWLGESIPCLHYGLRGVLDVMVEVQGANRDLHSGVDGGSFNEPMMDLVYILSNLVSRSRNNNNNSRNSFVDEDIHQVCIPHFYDDVRPVTPEEEALYQDLLSEFDPEQYKRDLGISSQPNNNNNNNSNSSSSSSNSVDNLSNNNNSNSNSNSNNSSNQSSSENESAGNPEGEPEKAKWQKARDLLMRRWRFPTLSVHSVASSRGTSSTTVIPGSVQGRVSIRLVPDQSADTIFLHLSNYLETLFAQLNSTNTLKVKKLHTGDWWLADPGRNPFFRAAEEAVEEVWGTKPLYTREGGTIPITTYLERTMRAPALHLPLGQRSDSAHLSNERIRLENLVKGKDVIKSLLLRVASIADVAGGSSRAEIVSSYDRLPVPSDYSLSGPCDHHQH